MNWSRPLGAYLAIGLLAVIAIGSLGFALLAVAAGQAEPLGDPVESAMAIVAGASGVFGLLAVFGGVGLWRGRAWGWICAFTVCLLGLLAVLTATVGGAFVVQLLVAVLLFGGTLVLLLLPAIRHWAEMP